MKNRPTQFFKGPTREILVLLSGVLVGAEGMEVNLATDHHSGSITKRSQIAFDITFIALSFLQIRARLLRLPVHY